MDGRCCRLILALVLDCPHSAPASAAGCRRFQCPHRQAQTLVENCRRHRQAQTLAENCRRFHGYRRPAECYHHQARTLAENYHCLRSPAYVWPAAQDHTHCQV